MQISKIARFPTKIREELNRRLESSEKSNVTLKWVNALPEVQAVLKKEFEGEQVTKQNLYKWKKSKSYQAWFILQSALQFTEDSLPDDLDQSTLDKMSDKLLHTLQLRYAAIASNLPPPSNDPEVELRRLGDLCNNLVMLRRGDLSAGRLLAVEQQRLAMEKARADEHKESEFWEWTKRPDIQARLYPHRDPDQQRRDVDRLVSERLLGIRRDETNSHINHANGHDPEPGCLI